ncbi:MAG: hypothetical protein ACOC8F_01395 [Planctomycetota bacterium]
MDRQTVIRSRGGQAYVFRYAPNAENEVIDAVMDLAERRDCPLDWVDAAAVGFEVARKAVDRFRHAARAPLHAEDR